MLGTDLAEQCEREGIGFEVFDLPEFDITNRKQLAEVVRRFEAIVNCAAYTDVEAAEDHAERAFAVNADAVGELGKLAAETGGWVLHISTDFVFDGTGDRPYVETDRPNPINAYGKSKLAGEQLLIESGCRCCIMRLQWTYGRAGANFVTKLITTAKKNPRLRVVEDQVGSPTATTEAAKAICCLLRKRPEGLFHYASKGYVSRLDMAGFIFDKLGMPVSVTGCKSSDYPSRTHRPLNSRFCCDKIEPLLDEPIARWEIPLERFLNGL